MSRLSNWLYRNFSFSIVRRSVLQNYPIIQKTQEILTQFEINLVLDVGANRGQYMSMLRKEIGYSGPAISFEPISYNQKMLNAKFSRDKHWSLQSMRIG